ncbi:MAG: GTPase HflX [Planctomycetota bacterium]|jgi:GTP-binding protein HflX
MTSKESENKSSQLIQLSPDLEKHLLIGVVTPRMLGAGEEPLEELASLVDTAGAEVLGSIYQKRMKPHSRTYFGKGKLAELVELVEELKPHTVVADSDLSPRQLKHLEEAVSTKVIDRSEVILDIFASRARTHQAVLQVSLAQLQYEMPRLGRKWTHLERLGGGIGTRGPGESQIETDRRLLRNRISRLKNELQVIEKRKEQEVNARKGEYTVSLVGYTNAGKSTIMNRLTGAGTLAEDKLFATLDTLTRSLDLGGGVNLLLSDTVGFLRRLPHHLVASFHATLEETVKADLLLHVVDAGSQVSVEQIRSVNQTLSSIECSGKEHLYVLNKCDTVQDRALFEMLKEKYRPNITVSALTGEGISELLEYLRDKASINKSRVTVRVKFNSGDGRRFSAINEYGAVIDCNYDGEQVVVTAELMSADVERLLRLPGEMEVLEQGQ